MTKTLNIKIASNCFTSLILILVGFYVFQVGSITREKCLVKSHINTIFSLVEYNKSLSVNFSKASSLNNIDNHLSSNSFVKPVSVNYIEVLNGSVVARSQ